MNGYMKCYDCGHDYPKNLLRRGYCSNCFEGGFLEAEAMKEFRESGYGDKPWNFDSISGDTLNKMRDDICYEYAFCLVSESFIHLGGKMHQDELVYKGTKKWEESKFITSLVIEKMIFNPFTSELIENSGFWKSVQEEINNL